MVRAGYSWMATTSSSSSTSPAEAALSQISNELVLKIAGDWSLYSGNTKQLEEVFAELEKHSDAKVLKFQPDQLGAWDTSLLICVNRVEEWCRAHQVTMQQGTLPAGIGGLLALADEFPERKTGRGAS